MIIIRIQYYSTVDWFCADFQLSQLELKLLFGDVVIGGNGE